MIDKDYNWAVSPLALAKRFSYEEGVVFHAAPHLTLISNAIVDAVYGDGPRCVAVSMPPQHGKSELISRRTPLWFLVTHPDKIVAVGGYGDDFAKEWGRKVKNDVTFHKKLLGFDISDDSSAANRWHTTKGGQMWTAGMGGQATGKGADLLIVDDPVKNYEDAFSKIVRDKVWDEFDASFMTRLRTGAAIIIVMTRWHEDDIVGRLLSGKYGRAEDWREIKLPAIWEENVPDAIGRKKGDPLFPELRPLKELEFRKNRHSPEVWEALYQQRPRGETKFGLAYSSYSKENVRDCMRDPTLTLFVSMDFNVDHMSWVIGQIRDYYTPMAYLTNERVVEVEILDEVFNDDATTANTLPLLLEKLDKLTKTYKPRLEIYGDASGGQRRTSSPSSDWQIVKQFFQNKNYDVKFYVSSSNPSVRDRVNAVNSALCSATGQQRLFIDPKCHRLITDLKEVRWGHDSDGNVRNDLDKRDQSLTHMSDAMGYAVYPKFNFLPTYGEKSGALAR